MASKRLYQLFTKRELQPAVLASSLVDVANGTVLVKDPKFTWTNEEYERGLTGGTLSPELSIFGRTKAEISFTVELAGTSTAATAPPWSHLLEACGMRVVNLWGATYADGTGAGGIDGLGGGVMAGSATSFFYNGQLLGTSGAAKVIRVIHDTYEGQSFVFYEKVTGDPAANDVFFPVGGSTGVGPTVTLTGGALTTQKGFAWMPVSKVIATATASAVTGTNSAGDILLGASSGAVIRASATVAAAAGQEFELMDGIPASGGEVFNNKSRTGTVTITTGTWTFLENPSVSIALVEDGRIKTARGCRGTVTFSGQSGQPMLMNFTFTGLLDSISNGGSLSGITYTSKIPPKMQAVDFKMGGTVSGDPGYLSHTTAHTPRLASFTFDLGASPALETDITGTNGYSGAAIQSQRRATQGDIKIGQRPDVSFPILRMHQNSEAFWAKMRIAGSTTAFTNNTFFFSTPGAFISGADVGESDGFATDDVSLKLTSRRPDGTEGEGGELVISFHYSGLQTW